MWKNGSPCRGDQREKSKRRQSGRKEDEKKVFKRAGRIPGGRKKGPSDYKQEFGLPKFRGFGREKTDDPGRGKLRKGLGGVVMAQVQHVGKEKTLKDWNLGRGRKIPRSRTRPAAARGD